IFLDDYIDPANVDVVDWSPMLALNPKPGMEDTVYKKLVHANPHLKVYRKAEVPERLHYRHHRRIPAIIGIADEGWSVTTHAKFEARPYYFTGGNHGFDNQLASMGGIFVARGPAFKSGLVVEPFENIQIYNLMATILHLKPAPNEGHLSAVRDMLTLK
ncbi:MAG: alkaline phosphatase family protein, partial [bacterium]